jgi:hypothetical protein
MMHSNTAPEEAKETMDPIIQYELAKAPHQRDRIKEAEHDRLVRQAMAGRSGVITRLLDRLGGLMIKIGEQLQIRSTPQITKKLGLAEN